MKKYFSQIIALFCLLLFTAIPVLANVKEVLTEEMASIISKNNGNANFIILDVRPKQAYEQGHIPDAISIPVRSSEFSAAIDKLDKTKTYLVYCVRGGMTEEAVSIMQDRGFENLIAAVEGIVGWSEAENSIATGSQKR